MYLCVYVCVLVCMSNNVLTCPQANHYGRSDISERLVKMASKDGWHLVGDIDKFLYVRVYEHGVCH